MHTLNVHNIFFFPPDRWKVWKLGMANDFYDANNEKQKKNEQIDEEEKLMH